MPRRSLRWPDPRVKPPYGSAEMDWAHPLAAHLSAFVPFWEGAGVPRTVSGVSITKGTQGWGAGVLGPRLDLTTGSGLVVIPEPLLHVIPTTAYTLAWAATYTVTGYQTAIVIAPAGEASISLFAQWQSDPAYLYCVAYNSGGTGRVFQATTLATAAATHIYHVTVNGAGVARLYQDGTLAATSASMASGIAWAAGTNVYFHSRAYSSLELPGSLSWAGLWATEWPPGHVAHHAAEPYAFLRPLIRRRYFVPAAGPSGAVPRLMQHYRRRRVA